MKSLSDVWFGITTIPTRIKIKSLQKKLDLINERKARSIMKEAKAQAADKTDVDVEIERAILNCDRDNFTKASLLTVAGMTNNWLKYCYWYITDPKSVPINNATIPEKEFCNAIVNIFGCPKIYPECGLADLDMYDLFNPQFASSPKFILNLSRVHAKNTINMQNKIAARNAILSMASPEPKPDFIDNKTIKPIIFSEPNESNTLTDPSAPSISPIISFDPKGDLTDQEYAEITKYLKPIFDKYPNMKYSLAHAKLPNRYDLTVYNQNGSFIYMVEKGTLGKDKYCIVHFNIGTYPLLVPLSFPAVENILVTNGQYQFTQDDLSALSNRLFLNYPVYQFVDLSDMDFDNMSNDDYRKLDTMLERCLRSIAAGYGSIPRLKLANYISPDKFSLVSNKNTSFNHSFDDWSFIAQYSTDDIMIIVDNDKMSVRVNNNLPTESNILP